MVWWWGLRYQPHANHCPFVYIYFSRTLAMLRAFNSSLDRPVFKLVPSWSQVDRMERFSLSSESNGRSRLWGFDSLPSTYTKPWQEYVWRYASIVSPCLLALVPRYMRKGGLQPAKQTHVTSYLDALRGVAALIVVNHHHLPYNRTWIVQQPFFRLINSGRGSKDNLLFDFRLNLFLRRLANFWVLQWSIFSS